MFTKSILKYKGNLLHILICKLITEFIAALMLTANSCLLQMGSCEQYCSLFKRITTQVVSLPFFDHLHTTTGPFTSSNTKAL